MPATVYTLFGGFPTLLLDIPSSNSVPQNTFDSEVFQTVCHSFGIVQYWASPWTYVLGTQGLSGLLKSRRGEKGSPVTSGPGPALMSSLASRHFQPGERQNRRLLCGSCTPCRGI